MLAVLGILLGDSMRRLNTLKGLMALVINVVGAAYFAIFDNTDSTVDITFRFRWYNFNGVNVVTKEVPAGSYFITRQKWVKAYTTMRIGYKDPDTGLWVNLGVLYSG